MALIVKTLPGVYGGVSNQTESLRKDNQVAEMVNCNPSLVLGTTRRPNAEAGVITIPSDASFIYDYQRSDQEANVLTVSEAGIITGETVGVGARTVTTTAAVTTYLTHTDKADLSAITIGDTTYIVNSNKEVGITSTATTTMTELDDLYKSSVSARESSHENMGYLWLSRSSNDDLHPYRYVAEINGTQYSAESDKADEAATALAATINGISGFTATSIGAIISFYKTDYSTFTFNFWDSWGSLASFGWKGSVEKLQDLPSSFPWDGAVVRINTSDGYAATDYYAIRWEGTWQEYTNLATYSGTTRYLPLLNNMPIKVVRGSDGNFTASLLTTADQLRPPLVGNTTNNKDPYFVGRTIKQLFYINGRICVVSGDALTFSEVDVLWNFYTSTVINVLDGDTIEVKIASEKVLDILRVAIFQSGLLIMTSEGQYLFNTEQGISPATVIVNKLSNYAYNDTGGTVYDGDSIVFSGFTGDTARIYRYRVARLTSENKALDLTIQIPAYITGVVTRIVNFVEDGTVIVLTENSQKLYVYKELISGDQMVQSSWHTWDFSNMLTGNILHTMVLGTYVYIVADEGVYKVPLGIKLFPSDYVHLDLGTTAYESRIELTKWRPKKTTALVQTPRGRLQLRAASVALEGEANLEIYKEDRDYTQVKPILYNKNINVLSNTDKTVLSIINNSTSPFTISGIALSGTYRDKGKEKV